MTPEEQLRLSEALAFALEHHADQTRKGKPVPYVAHLLQVAGLVFEHGGGMDEAVAGLLHDTVEDCETVDLDAVRHRFGPVVAGIVDSCTDTLEGDTPEKKSPWKERKLAYIEHLREASKPARLVSACDKLHNLSDILADLRLTGPETLERFSAEPRQLLWYFEAVREAAGPDLPDSLRSQLDHAIADFRQQVEAFA
ncbi:MAG: HD domain-containing protein [Deltaproteobacteria bacterium]|nr:HD domain-containing protein [Deltaproteobacteria bacterium]MBW2419450.1 HD domain-containing protein [Deltaproteobacteria bacterium]